MSDLTDLHDYESRPKKKNPFRSKPIPKTRIEWAIRSTLSIRAAAQYLGVSYNTFKKYAKMYDLFEQNKNQAGKGITTKGNTGWGVKIQDLFDRKHPNYPHYKLQERIIELGYNLKLLKSLKDFLGEIGFDEEYGARPLNRAIQKYVEDPISEEILKGTVKEGQTLIISYSKVKEKVEVRVLGE